MMWSPNCLVVCNEDETKPSFKLNYDLKKINWNENDENLEVQGIQRTQLSKLDLEIPMSIK